MGVWQPQDAFQFLEHAHSLGAAGIQAPLNGDLSKLRAQAEHWGMYIEAWAPMPRGHDSSAFDQALKDAKTVGAVAIRAACLDTRRYETFSTPEQWRQFLAARSQSIEAALPLLDRYKIPLGIENHKDWTAEELAHALAAHSSEYLGVCLDLGNNISLLDDPMRAIEVLAPFAVSTHIKDIAVSPAPNHRAFLLSEVILGHGLIDLPRSISLIQASRPQTRLSLEMITRDPLLIPCHTDAYWATFPERDDALLASALAFVRQHSSPLPAVSRLSRQDRLALENENVIACLRYARDQLAL